jgi:hypothetical protein
LYLCMEGRRAIRCIVECLSMPQVELRRIMLEILFDIFRIQIPTWLPDLVSSRNGPSRSIRHHLSVFDLSSSALPSHGWTGRHEIIVS